MKPTSVCIALLLAFPQFALSYNILFMVPFPGPSHWLWLEQFINGLLSRGHYVTVVTNFLPKQQHENCTVVPINPIFDIPKHYPKSTIFEMRYTSDFQNLHMWWNLGLQTSEHALNDSGVKKIIQSDLHFDLIILEQFFHESFLMFGHKFNAPIVTIGTMGYADNMDHAMGLLTPWSFIPHLVLPYTDQMSFTERAYNTYLSAYDYVLRRWSYMPKMQAMAERHFKEHINGPLPSVRDLEKNISSHRSVDLPRPSMPGLVNVGGIHIKPAKKLPNGIQEGEEFLDKSKHGVVYFSLGSYMKSTDMPPEKIGVLLKAFGQLKQNVLWKYEDDNLENLPKNVMIKKWMPQNDILAHKKVLLFITHGGIFGTQEGIHWGVPMLCVPLFADQHRNTIKSVRQGYALRLDFSKMTVSDIVSKIKALIEDPQYRSRAKEVSALFRDNPIHPMDEAMFWIEYVVTNKGAPNLKSNGVHLPFYKYVLLDVLFVFLVVASVCVALVYKVLKFASAVLKGSSVKPKQA